VAKPQLRRKREERGRELEVQQVMAEAYTDAAIDEDMIAFGTVARR